MTVKAANMPTLSITRDDWEQVVDAVNERVPMKLSPWPCLFLYSVCPVPLFSEPTIELWNIYNACGGTSRLSKPADYYELPALYADACKVIESELAEVNRGKN